MNTETEKVLDPIAEFRVEIEQLEELCKANRAVWRIEASPLNSDHTIHFYAVKADENGEGMIAAVGRGIGRDFVRLIIQSHNNLSELIRYARIGLEATAELTANSEADEEPCS